MDSDNRELEEISVKLSNRNDINSLYEKYGSKLYYDIKNIKLYQNEYELWRIFANQKDYSIIGLCKSFIYKFSLKLQETIFKYEKNINVNNVKETIVEEMLENIYKFSNGIFLIEIKDYQTDEKKFFKCISNDYVFFKQIINKYPHWYSVINQFLLETSQFLIDFLRHLINDIDQITTKFFKSISKVENICLFAGDRHNGKFVIEVITSCGDFFYKPRSADIESAFQIVLQKISNSPNILNMECVEFQNHEKYSWFKKVQYKPIAKLDEKNYYLRLGQLLAITYILNGGDIHYENIISHGEYPIIIDNEALLTSRLRFKKNSTPLLLQMDTINYLEDSVRNSLILPNVICIRDNYFEFSPLKMYDDELPNTPEDVRKIFSHKIFKSDLNRISPYICEGFYVVYKEICESKEEYTKLFIELFGKLKVRFINKPTDDYAQIKELLLSPICMFDFRYAFAIAARILDTLSNKLKYEEQVEQKELLGFNIPFFEIKSNTKNLIMNHKKIFNNFFSETPIDSLKHKINLIGDKDLSRQIIIIKQMFMIMCSDFKVSELNSIKLDLNCRKIDYSKKEITNFIDETVNEIFNNSTANPLTDQYIWSGPELQGNIENGKSFYHSIDYPASYYMGNVGILTGLLKLSMSSRYDKYVSKLIKDIEIDVNQIISITDGGLNIGAFNGISQYVRLYLTLYTSDKISKSYFIRRTSILLNKIMSNILSDKKLDILDGIAGVILTAVKIFESDISNELNEIVKELLNKCCNHLIDSIIRRNGVTYFPFEQDDEKYFTGFAHGTSGIILALYKASKISNLDSTKIIAELLNTERKLYNKSNKYWYSDNTQIDHSWGWCHGIPGILLSRVTLVFEGYNDQRIIDEINELYDITVLNSMGTNLTLCHGDLGNIIIALYTQKTMGFKDDRIYRYIKSITPKLIASRKFTIRGAESEGLLQGMMGIVCFLDAITTNNITSLVDILRII
ncbi:type 2 lanthipeptide synthetase LanM [Pseudolactococcus carnosus]|uniref:type 2 lanthipeptide synthetase LanM n=1 Tax=Pseudolactococcus carnosus TaxID=2749961 RepID=UPI001FB93FB9|nr:type 2 lanthipeptide synthetase LanM [Lactococcus carnosus]MCJ1978494.1 type 2 lantipeptide synthetase LanM [Lactococcus carnosus]